MAADRIVRQFAFLLECDRLKDVLRRTISAHTRRPENDAEHSWGVCLLAMTLAEHSNAPVDLLRVIRMLLIHDVVEIDAGDTFAYDVAGVEDQHAREAVAAARIFGMLPDDQAADFRALWDEFEARATDEVEPVRVASGLSPRSRVLVFNTEGAIGNPFREKP